MYLNILSTASYPADVLSNFAMTRFVLDDVECCSVEGVIQAMKHKDEAEQLRICQLAGIEAKRAGAQAMDRVIRERTIWWRGNKYEFQSLEHMWIIRNAIHAKFEQNKCAREALKDSCGMMLVHNTGKSESLNTSLPASEFIHILYGIRNRL